MKKGMFVVCILFLVTIFTAQAGDKVIPYMGIFIENEAFQKKGKYATLYLHLSKAPSQVKSTHKLVLEKLLQDGWNPVDGSNAENFPSEIRIFAGVNLEEYKNGVMKKGEAIVVSYKGKDFVVDAKKKSQRETYASQVIEKVNASF